MSNKKILAVPFESPDSDDPLFEAGHQFVEQNLKTADDPQHTMWHGWMVRQAFWEGAWWAREQSEKRD